VRHGDRDDVGDHMTSEPLLARVQGRSVGGS
jgi:hypothetical protein